MNDTDLNQRQQKLQEENDREIVVKNSLLKKLNRLAEELPANVLQKAGITNTTLDREEALISFNEGDVRATWGRIEQFQGQDRNVAISVIEGRLSDRRLLLANIELVRLGVTKLLDQGNTDKAIEVINLLGTITLDTTTLEIRDWLDL